VIEGEGTRDKAYRVHESCGFQLARSQIRRLALVDARSPTFMTASLLVLPVVCAVCPAVVLLLPSFRSHTGAATLCSRIHWSSSAVVFLLVARLSSLVDAQHDRYPIRSPRAVPGRRQQ
jgi:hypothetical protein